MHIQYVHTIASIKFCSHFCVRTYVPTYVRLYVHISVLFSIILLVTYVHSITLHVCVFQLLLLFVPGTEFMVRLDQQLKYFVNKKISTDPTWRNVRVVFSGHEVCTYVRV